MSVRIYVEGGGSQNATLSKCKTAFSRFFAKVVREGRMPRVIACGSRNSAYDDFATALRIHPSDTIILLVDSEDAVAGLDCWLHLRNRDGWDKPPRCEAESVYLMVRCMESWFMSDKEALIDFYGQSFGVSSLPQNINIEDISKVDVASGLARATRPTGHQYHKTQHGFDILASLDPTKVAAASPHAKRIIDYLRSL